MQEVQAWAVYERCFLVVLVREKKTTVFDLDFDQGT